MDATIKLLKELTEAHGVPGYEAPVRAVLRKHLKPLGELSEDKLGNLVRKKQGSAESPRVMLAGIWTKLGSWSTTSPRKVFGFLHSSKGLWQRREIISGPAQTHG